MDPRRFDVLVQTLGAGASRRRALATLLAGLIAPLLPGLAAEADRGRGKSKRKDQGKKKAPNKNKNNKDNGTGEKNAKAKAKTRKKRTRAEAAAGCCSGGNCTPGPGKNLTKCCYEGQILSGKSFKGGNLTKANFKDATLTNAKFQSTNLTGACFVGAIITGANFQGSNQSGVIRCRTITASGDDNSGCDKGTICCPTCDTANPCAPGQVCCDGRCIPGECCGTGGQSTCGFGQLCCGNNCVAGDCCSNAQCDDPVAALCLDHTCSPCSDDGQCGIGQVCCDGVCEDGDWTNQTTFGTAGSLPSQFSQPTDVAVAEDGLTAWVSDFSNQRVAVWTRPNAGSTNWTNQTTFGGGGNGANQFSQPFGIAVSSDELVVWVADATFPPNLNHNRISVWTRPNVGSTAWTHQTNFGSGPGSGANQFNRPAGVAISADGLTVWIGDRSNNRISVWTRPAATSTAWTSQTTFGSAGSGANQFAAPDGVAVSADGLTVWVVDQGNDRVSIWTRPNAGSTNWTNQTTFGSAGSGIDKFNQPRGVAVAADGRIVWVSDADATNNRISVWTRPTATGTAWTNQTTFGSPGSGADKLNGPLGVAVAADELTVWVADSQNHRISVWGLVCPAP